MANTSLQAYLAAKYMSGPKADAILSHASVNSAKKKKRKVAASSSNKVTGSSMIKDDDVMGWAENGNEGEDEDDLMSEVVVADDRGFKKRQRTDEGSGWATVREGERGRSPSPAARHSP